MEFSHDRRKKKKWEIVNSLNLIVNFKKQWVLYLLLMICREAIHIEGKNRLLEGCGDTFSCLLRGHLFFF